MVEVIGVPSRVLMLEAHDPRQLWLPFVIALLVRRTSNKHPEAIPALVPREKLREIVERKFASIAPENRLMFPGSHEGDTQCVLPFTEHLRLNKNQARVDNSQASFERVDGSLIEFKFSRTDTKALVEWCRSNCKGRYIITTNKAVFEKHSDAALARLVVGP